MANKIVSWSTSVRQSPDSPLTVSRSPIIRRAGLSRGHPAIVPRVRGTNPLCPSTMPRLNVRAHSSPSNPRRVLCAPFVQRNYHGTLSKQESIQRAPRPHSRIERVRHADCKSSRDRRDRRKGERDATERYEFVARNHVSSNAERLIRLCRFADAITSRGMSRIVIRSDFN